MKRFRSILKLLILLAIILGPVLYAYFVSPEFLAQFQTMEGVNAYLARYRISSGFIYIGLQFIQIVISIIPGQFIQFAGGYAFGFWLGYLLSIIGIALGTLGAFYLSRLLGRDAVYLFFGEKRIEKFIRQLNSKRAFAILFALYLIPGFPKDLIVYAAGVSGLRSLPFLLLSLVGRTPALMATILMGVMLREESYVGMIIFGVAVGVVFIVSILYRHRLMQGIDSIYQKWQEMNKIKTQK